MANCGRAVREGIFHALQGGDAYAGGLLHQPPLVMLPSIVAGSFEFPFDGTLAVLMADLLAAYAVADIMRGSRRPGAAPAAIAACMCALARSSMHCTERSALSQFLA